MPLLLCLTAIDGCLDLFTRDISQAYVQSDTTVQRPVFVRPPSTLTIPLGTLIKVEFTPYGLPEASVHRFRTYCQNHCDDLDLTPATHNLCFLYTPHEMSDDTLKAPVTLVFTCLQTDDARNAGNTEFIKAGKKAQRNLIANQLTSYQKSLLSFSMVKNLLIQH